MMTSIRTALCERVGIRIPIVQAPIGSAAGPALAAAVSSAGGLGMLALTWRDLDAVRAALRETRDRTDRPFGVNLVLAWDPRERLELCLAEGATLVSFFWGDPDPYVDDVHGAGGLVIHTVGSVAEARAAVDAGVDVIVAQGREAGGHVRGTVPMLELLAAVREAVDPVPVLAAGGIAHGRGVAEVLGLGAAGAWVGTRFLASEEAAAHRVYKDALIDAAAGDTVYTRLFDLEWPNAPHRVLRNSTVRLWEAAGRPSSGTRPGEGTVVARWPDGRPVLRYSDTIPLPGMTGDLEALALYAGAGVGAISSIEPAAVILERLAREAAAHRSDAEPPSTTRDVGLQRDEIG